jgi:hypothetical protein
MRDCAACEQKDTGVVPSVGGYVELADLIFFHFLALSRVCGVVRMSTDVEGTACAHGGGHLRQFI